MNTFNDVVVLGTATELTMGGTAALTDPDNGSTKLGTQA